MSDTTAETAAPPQPDTPAPDGEKTGEEQRVPYARFEEVNSRAKHAERELEDLRQRIVDFEERDKSEAERAKNRAERAESQLSQLQNTVTSLQKGSWVRSAAAELNFHDPEDAVAHLGEQLARFEDERDAKRAVKSLSQSKKHLIRGEDAKPDRARIGRVFSAEDRAQVPPNGANGDQGRSRPLSRDQVAAQRESEFAHGLAAELNQFRAGWREMGGLT
jgi:DNA repair exonuclease SbcCD ATPase subunit